MLKNPKWIMKDTNFKSSGGSKVISTSRKKNLRNNVKWWSFEFIGDKKI
jgi:hypothetical protein